MTNSKQTSKYFYLDARDSDFGGYEYLPDFWIYFNNSIGKYFYTEDKINWTEIYQGEVVRIWDIHDESANTSELQNYWNNVLVAVNNDNHPELIWGPYPSTSLTIDNYRIYRKYGYSEWNLLTTVSSTTYKYIDESVSLTLPGGPAGTDVKYYIKAVYNTNIETPASNSLTVNVKGLEIEKRGNSKRASLIEFKLGQNYPNPFNPSTTISFSVAKNTFVKLKVYDILGNEIANLVNETKEPGNYSVSFEAAKLSSGIYFYTLNTNGYSFTKKMLLTK